MVNTDKRSMTQYLVVLSIAGSDPSGGAGIQADLKTLSALGVYAASVITALTVQNTCGVSRVVCVEPEVVEAQIRAVVSDLRPRVIKVGMVGSQAVLEAIVRTLRDVAGGVPLIVDPILKSSSGADLMEPAAQAYFCRHFLPLVTLLTPNLPETAALTGLPVESAADVRRAAARLLDMGPEAVLIKGGHAGGPQKQDVLFWHAADGSLQHAAFEAPAVATRNTHGTGCTLSSAIAAYRARGLAWPEAVAGAKRYITQALQAGADVTIGQGTGPLNHFFSPQPLIKQNV